MNMRNRQIPHLFPVDLYIYESARATCHNRAAIFLWVFHRFALDDLYCVGESSIVSRFLVRGLSPVKLTASELNRQDQAQRQGWRCCQGSLEGCRRMFELIRPRSLYSVLCTKVFVQSGAQVSQDPHFHHLPPSQDPSALPVAQVPPQVDPS